MLKISKTLVLAGFTALAAIIFVVSSLTTVTTATNNFAFQTQTNSGQEISGQEISGKDLYQNSCAKCHGANGEGGKGPNLASAKKQAKWKESDEKLVAKITNGGWGMPAFGKKLKPAEIKAIANYVRTFASTSNNNSDNNSNANSNTNSNSNHNLNNNSSNNSNHNSNNS